MFFSDLGSLRGKASEAVQNIERLAQRYAQSVEGSWPDVRGGKIAEGVVSIVRTAMSFPDYGVDLLREVESFDLDDSSEIACAVEQAERDLKEYAGI